MEMITIGGKEYGYVNGFRDDDKLRAAFNRLTREVYGFDFENWFSSGNWGDNYIPHALMDGEQMVSNIACSLIEFNVAGQTRTYVQIGTVMTSSDYRHKQLNRALMEKVLATWRGKCDLIYLFANDSVLEFYPKFGFTPVQEYQYVKTVKSVGMETQLKKLDMGDQQNQERVFSIASKAHPISRLAMQGNVSLIMFWLMSFYADYVYYSEKYEAVIVMRQEGDELLLMDVFSEKSLELDELLSSLILQPTQSVVLGFTPKDKSSFEERNLQPDDVLFVLDDKHGLCSRERFMFPLLSHA